MKSAVVNLMKCSDGSIVASNRIAKFLAYHLGVPLIDQKEAITGYDNDRIYIVNGPLLYCTWRDEFKKLVENAKEVVWIANEYGIEIPKFIREKNPFILSNYDNIQKSERHSLVNWNYLIYNPNIKAKETKYKGLCYYGAYRQDREVYFKKYILDKAPYEMHVSSSAQGTIKFKNISKKPHYFKATDLLSVLGMFESSLYIEDVFTHTCYNHPANRFYEAISTHTLQLFDKSCLGTFEKAGVDIKRYIVDGPEEYAEKLKDSENLRREQVEEWHSINYIEFLKSDIKRAFKQLGL